MGGGTAKGELLLKACPLEETRFAFLGVNGDFQRAAAVSNNLGTACGRLEDISF